MARFSLSAVGQSLRDIFAGKGSLPPLELPRGKAGQKSTPGYLRSASPTETPLQKTDRNVASTDPLDFRRATSTRQVIANLVATNPDLSAAVSAYLRTGIPDDYKVVARNPDGSFNREATNLTLQVISRINLVQNYADGFSGIWTLRTVSEALGKELMLDGACALELVLDKALLPAYFAPVAVSTVSFIPDKSSKFKFVRPIQKVGGAEIDLDVPTFFYVALDQSLTDMTPASPLESAVQPALFSIQFMNDVRRVIRKAIHPRLDVEIDYDKIVRLAPPGAHNNPDKMREFEQQLVSEVESTVNSLEPEEALVRLSFLKVSYLTGGNTSLDREYEVLGGMADAKLATGAKVLPSVLGHGTGTQNVASAEALMFMKNANGVIRSKLNEIYSRAFTLALRLMGYDVSVEFTYDTIDLRPDTELEAFRTMRQGRILDQLSLGFITDDEAALELTGKLTPAGFTSLSGTRFRDKSANPAEGAGNPYSGAPQGGGQSGGGAQNQQNKSGAPTDSHGSPGKKAAALRPV